MAATRRVRYCCPANGVVISWRTSAMARTFPFPGLGTLTAQYAGVEQDIYAKGSPEPLDAYVAGYGLQTETPVFGLSNPE